MIGKYAVKNMGAEAASSREFKVFSSTITGANLMGPAPPVGFGFHLPSAAF
jgi:hypothetical protein